MKVGKNRWAIRSVFVLILGVIVNYLCGYVIAYFQYLTFYKIPGLQLVTEEFLKEPLTAFRVLILGDTSKEVFIAIHEVYTNPLFHIIFISFYAYFVFAYFSKSKRMEKKDASDYGSHGTAKWATNKEIKPLTKDKVGFILGELKKETVVHPMSSKLNQIITTFGGSGSGKTAGYGIPNILHNAEKVGESLVITDPKGELYNKTSSFLREHDYKVLCYNLLDMTRSMRQNPLDYVHSTEEALSLANMIISNTEGKNSSGDSMWKNAEMAYFAALMMYLKEMVPKELQTIKSVLQLGTRIGADEEVLDNMFEGLPDDSEALEMYNIFRLAQDKTRAGILIGFGVRLKLWVSKNVANLTSTSDFDLNQLGQEKTALFLLIPDSESTFDLLPALLIDQAFNQLYKQAGRNDSERLNVPVRFILDELANISAINDFERKVSTMRSRGISVVPIFQSITQFKNRYDQDRWSEILASSDTIVFLGTQDKMTAKYFSEKLGNTTLLINSLSESSNTRGDSESRSHNVIGRPLMTPDEIERMSDQKVIIFQRGKRPMLLDKHFYFKQKQWANLKKVNWYTETEPRKDEKIKVIDRSSIREIAATKTDEEVNENPKIASEEETGYIKELMSEEENENVNLAKDPEKAEEIEQSNVSLIKDEAIPISDLETIPSFSDEIESIDMDIEAVDIEEELSNPNFVDHEDSYLASLMDSTDDKY